MPWWLLLWVLAVWEALPRDVRCAKLGHIYWNSSSPMFRIDNTDHVIDVNVNNPPYEYDQVNLVCPVYPPGTHEDDAEKYIIYNVSKEEYDTCTITSANPRIIAVCDKPYRYMFFTITFRPFTPQPGGLEFRPGQDYYFISTSSKDNLFSRLGGHCLTHNMRVVFKVCCKPNQPLSLPSTSIPPATTTSITTTRRPRPMFIPQSRPTPYLFTIWRTTTTTQYPTTTTMKELRVPEVKVIMVNTAPGGSGDRVGIRTRDRDKTKKSDIRDKSPNETNMKTEELVNGSTRLRHPGVLSLLLIALSFLYTAVR